ncbi:cell division cycle protein 27 homolog B isoform X2 [Nymphaea colorata]|uniref:cell division cycle protein 27 homolog B isoform X2 n=1 Tax=Nymphaea colorata TaxID=210225 RepID=UPI00129D8413|nr:cell division cycle protein 27 homolog B isoform X2 [Nymphaea colorata]
MDPFSEKDKSSMEPILVECVNGSLRLYMHRNATFLCERLCAEFPSEANLQLLARCYLQNNQAYRAYHILKGTQMPQCRYLFAISCFQMDLLREAEAALCPPNEPNNEVPNGAAGHYLLGLIYRYTDRRRLAVEHFMQALSMDPLMWAAYEELCILGAAEDANEVFGESAIPRLQQHCFNMDSGCCNLRTGTDEHSLTCNQISSSDEMSPKLLKQSHASHVRDTAGNLHGAAIGVAHVGQQINFGSTNTSPFNTPSPVSSQLASVAPPPVYRNVHIQQNISSLSGEFSPKSTANAVGQAPRRKLMDEGKLRKVPGRLFSDSAPRRSTRLAGDATNHANSGAHFGGNGTNHSSNKLIGGYYSKMNSSLRSVTIRKGQAWVSENFDKVRRSDTMDNNGPDDIACSLSVVCDDKPYDRDRANTSAGTANLSKFSDGALELLGLLRILGEGYRLSRVYRCQEAVETFLKLPPQQYATGWVLCQVGKAYYEMVNYLEAELAFSWARRVSPYMLDEMDVYSTVLFHLKEDMKLSYLAQELISVDRLSPQAWCAVGNCYSLQKDHETALKSFQRAVHLDLRFAYGQTLCGHEYVSMEDFENGVKCYQGALRIDSRHYNAWYGLGMIYLRQEKFEFAEHHFRSAFQINPRSSVLMCYLGMALHALKRNDEALDILQKAISADEKNPLPMFERANILASVERFDEALQHLEQLKEFAPRESSVHALMGKIYKRLNRHDKAMFHFGVALDLRPPEADVAAIKSAMEKLHVPDEVGVL